MKSILMQAEKLIEYFNDRCNSLWDELPEMHINFDDVPVPIPDYSNYEKYL